MKLSKLLAFMAMGFISSAFAGWTSFDSALAEAKTSNKPILVNFSTRNVDARAERYNAKFRSEEFDNYASGRLLLANVILTGPKGWMKQQETEIKKAQVVAIQYGVSSIPTVLVLTAAGQRLGVLTSAEGTPDDFVKRLDAITRLGLVAPKAKATPPPSINNMPP